MWKIITSLFLLCAFSFQAQNTLPLEWSKNPKVINPGGQYTVAEIAFDETSSTGNALPIKIGNFSNTANFNFAEDIENGVFEVAESELDAYIAKYDENDALLWVKKINGTGTFTMEHIVVNDNFFYVLGTLSGTVDFNPTTAIANKTSAGDASLVIAKYDLNGFYVNAKVIDFDSNFEVQKFKTNGALLAIVGEFSGNIDFGLSSNMGSFGGNDGFMALYNTNLSFQSAAPIGGLGDDVASDVVFHNNHMYISSVEQDVLEPMCSADLPTEGAYTGQYQLNVLTSGQYGPLFEDGIVTITGSGTNRNFTTTNLYPLAGPFNPINFQMQLDYCGNLTIPKTNTGLQCSSNNNLQFASLNIDNSYNIYNDSTLTLEFYNDVDQSCGTPELTRIELTKVDTPVEDYNIDLSGNTPKPFTYSNYLKKYDLNGTLVLNTAIGSDVNLSDSNLEDSKHYLHTNLHVTNNNEIALLGAYTGNKSFGNNNTSEVPPFSAPLPLPRNTEDVISIFSGAYNDLPNTNYFPNWGQGPESTAYMFNLNGDDMLQFNNLTYQGIQLDNGTDIDVSNMEYLHVDVWTNENVTQLETSLINNSNGVVTENAVLSPLNANGWTSIDIPISEYTNQGLNVSQIWQLKFAAKQSDWGLIGSSTPNGWNGPDMKMLELAPNKYALYADLTAGEFKFRFNNDWNQNYGDNGANGSLDYAGNNIALAEAGRYYITLNLNTFKYTIEPAELSSQGAVFIDNIYFYKSATAKPVKPNLVMASSATPFSKNTNTASIGDFSLPQISGYNLGYFLCKINPEDVTINNIDPLFISSIYYNYSQPTFLSAYEAVTNSLILLNKTETQIPMRFDYTGFDFSNYEMNRSYYFYKFNVDDPNNLSIKPIYSNSPTNELIVGGNEIFQLSNASYGYTDYDVRINSTNYIETSGYPIINHYSLDGDYRATTLFNKGVRRANISNVLNDIDSQENIYFVTGNSSGLDINNDNTIDVPLSYSDTNSSISKYDFNGNLLWSNALIVNFGGVKILKFKIDNNDDLLIFGEFKGEGYFDSNSNEMIASSQNENNTVSGYVRNFFVAKYNSEGELLWFNRLINNIYFRSNGSHKLALDDNNNIYLQGTISKNTDNDTAIDIDPRDDFAFYINFPDDASNSAFPLFVKYDTQGNIVFAKVGDPKLYREARRSSIAINDNKLQFLFYKYMYDHWNETDAIVDLDLSLENEVIVDTYRKEVLVNYSLDGSYLSHHILSDKSNFYDIEGNQSQSAFMSKPITDNNNNIYIIARHRNSFENVNQLNDINYSRLFISKYDTNYNLIWEKNIGTPYGYYTNAAVHKSGKLVLNFSYKLNADLTNLESNLIFNSSEIVSVGTGLLIIEEDGELWYHKNIVNSFGNHLSLTDEHLVLSGNYADSIYLENNSIPEHRNNNIWEPYLAIFNIENVLNIPKNKFNPSCSVYPNPSKAIINIVVDHFKSATIHNIMGQKILDVQQQEIDLSGHKSGIYLVKVKTSQGKTFVRKVVKN